MKYYVSDPELEEDKGIITKRMIPRHTLINILREEVIDISGFKCIPLSSIQKLLGEDYIEYISY